MADADNLAAGLAALTAHPRRLMLGVRHHSPACAAALPALLDGFAPDVVLLELPADFAAWLPWLGHAQTRAPVALAAAATGQGVLGFHPFADHSPELAAVRWAVARGVPVVPCDLPLLAREPAPHADDAVELELGVVASEPGERPDTETLWDVEVESRANPDQPQATQRAALLFGLWMRQQAAQEPDDHADDLRREAWMRQMLADHADRKVAVVVGAFHCAGLLDEATDDPLPRVPPPPAPSATAVTSLLPYRSDLFDARSGYPAGIRDPLWQQRTWRALANGTDPRATVAEVAVDLCRHLRGQRHVAGVPDAAEVVRVAEGLAALRGLPRPGRREALEAVQTALGQGELWGRGRALARSLQAVLVGRVRGELAPGTPRSGLLPAVVAELAELKLPGPDSDGDDPKYVRWDPLRSPLDRRRVVMVQRLAACHVPYAARQGEATVGGVETLTESWQAQWTAATEAALMLAATAGTTLAQAAAGTLHASWRHAGDDDERDPEFVLGWLVQAAEAGLHGLTRAGLAQLVGSFLEDAGLAQLLRAVALSERITCGHVAALPVDSGDRHAPRFALPPGWSTQPLVVAALSRLPGLQGSRDAADVQALAELVALIHREGTERAPGRLQLAHHLHNLVANGSPTMQGAATWLLYATDQGSVTALSTLVGSWLDCAIEVDALRELSQRIAGVFGAGQTALCAHAAAWAGLAEQVAKQADADFWPRVPALRKGFDVLSPAARQRWLEHLGDQLGDAAELDVPLAADAATLALWRAADAAGLQALRDAGLAVVDSVDGQPAAAPAGHGDARSLDRWRVLLGREPEQLAGQCGRAARSLDDLYGRGSGEGSQSLDGPGGLGLGGGDGQPDLRERLSDPDDWAAEIEAIFGSTARLEILPTAVENGRLQALDLDPETVPPSVDLLSELLALQGGLPEAQVARLRPLVASLVRKLTEALAQRLQPAWSGLSVARSTRRRGPRLDLRRTIAANLKHAQRNPTGGVDLWARELHFVARARKSLDWHLWLLVDVSGSMSASVVYSAMMSAILSGLPALSVRFAVFSTKVIDLSESAADPLALLLDIEIGGGTHIAKALRYARERITQPRRTLLLCVSDFEEGGPAGRMLGEVRALVESGVACLGIGALDDRGAPYVHQALASQVAAAGMPVAALSPLDLARWVAEQMAAAR